MLRVPELPAVLNKDRVCPYITLAAVSLLANQTGQNSGKDFNCELKLKSLSSVGFSVGLGNFTSFKVGTEENHSH